MQTVMIVNSDLGFVFWLGALLDNAGYRAIPARRVRDAVLLLERFSLEPDLLIVDPSLPGADLLVEHYRRANVRVIALPREIAPRDERSSLEWLDLVATLFESPQMGQAAWYSRFVFLVPCA